MLNAITSLITKTVDVFLNLNSSEARRRKISKNLFHIYKALRDIHDSLGRVEGLLDLACKAEELDDFASYLRLEKTSFADYLNVRGTRDGKIALIISSIDSITLLPKLEKVELEPARAFPVFLLQELDFLKSRLIIIGRIMNVEAIDLNRLTGQPDLLRAFEIYDSVLVEKFHHAWNADIAMVELLQRIGLNIKVDNSIISLIDTNIVPSASDDWDLRPHILPPKHRVFDVKTEADRLVFSEILSVHKEAISFAKVTVGRFLSDFCSIEDIL